LQNKFRLIDADEAGAGLPSKYTRTPGQINPKTGEMQTLYCYDKNIIDVDEILDDLPRIHDQVKPIKEYKGKLTLEALKKHIEKLDWSEGNRFTAVQHLSPNLISLVSDEELFKMIPCTLEKDHKYVIRYKRKYYEKIKAQKELEEEI
jgi:hypothetical protein